MHFGLCNASTTFQRLVMYIFSDLLYKSLTVYIYDFNMQSSVDDHLEYVRETLKRCRKMRLALNPEKTYLAVQRGVLLGYVVSEKGREPDPEKIVVIDRLSAPTNAKDIAKLLGHVSWYLELIPGYAKIALPITKLLRNDVKFEWTEVYQQAFDELRGRLSTYPVLQPPRRDLPYPGWWGRSNAVIGEIFGHNWLRS